MVSKSYFTEGIPKFEPLEIKYSNFFLDSYFVGEETGYTFSF